MPPPKIKIKTRFLLLSDTHTLTPSPPSAPSTASTPYRHPLPECHVLLHAGDITKVGLKSEHVLMLSLLKSHPAELKIVIAGNHDISLDQDYYSRLGWLRHRYVSDHTSPLPKPGVGDSSGSGGGEGGGGGGGGNLEDPLSIKALYTSDEAIKAGIRYMEEEIRTFTVPSTGAKFTVYATPYTPEFCQWAFAYPRDLDRFNNNNDNNNSPQDSKSAHQQEQRAEGGGLVVPSYPGVDVLLTHGPPYGILDRVVGTGQSIGCEHLYRAVERARPALHVFGHIHEGYGARRVEWEAGAGSESRPDYGSRTLRRREEEVSWDRERVLEERCAYVDVSSGSGRPLRRGEETLFVNASVVTVNYEPLNAPWVVDLDLDPDLDRQAMDEG